MKPAGHTRASRSFFPARSLSILILFLTVPILSLCGQLRTDEVKTYISLLDRGQTDEVRRALPDLVTRYPNTAGKP